jgi:hypothetical protein
MTPDTLKASLLIEIRNSHTAKIAEQLVHTGIVPKEYLDKLIRIDIMNQLKLLPAPQPENPDGFNDEQRIRKLIQLLQKHSVASTASWISNLYS